MACRGFQDLNRKRNPDKVLRGKTFNIAKNSKYDPYQGGLTSMLWIFLIKNFWWSS